MKDPKKIKSIVLISILSLALLAPYYGTRIVTVVQAGCRPNAWYNDSTLSVSVIRPEPRINWYDFQYNDSGTWVSRLNQQIEVNNESEYRFIVNVSSDQGWENITFINITAWYDQGSESSEYNTTQEGGNFNMFLQYENTSETSNEPEFHMLWPTDGNEVTFINGEEQVVTDPHNLTDQTETRNISFSFIPHKQFRYAPGPGSGENWSTNLMIINTSYYGLFNTYSWNFNITIENRVEGGYRSWIADEFGVYRYSEIISADDPKIIGEPGRTHSVNDGQGSGNISIITKSNGNYSLSVEIFNLTHERYPVEIGKNNVSVRGGNRPGFTSLDQLVFLYGGGQDGMPAYHPAEANKTKCSTEVEFQCYIPYILPGEYSSQIKYHLITQE